MKARINIRNKQLLGGGISEEDWFIEKVNNCATRLRITVKDEALVQPDDVFRSGGAHGVVRNGNAFQVIVGLDVPQVREQFETLMNIEN